MHAPVAAAQRIAFDDAESFDEADHDLRAGDQSASETEQKPFPGMLAFAHEILGDDVVAAGRKNESEAFGDFAEGAVERGGAADDSQRQKQHGKKGEEHVEGDGLAERDAVWKDAAQAAKESFEYSLHEVVGGIIRLVTANRAKYLGRPLSDSNRRVCCPEAL